MFEFAETASKNGFGVIVAGAGGSAHLPGMVASLSSVPVIGVPIESKKLKGLDSLLSIVQMPKGCPVATMAIGAPGAFNAAIFAIQVLAVSDIIISRKIKEWRFDTTNQVKDEPE